MRYSLSVRINALEIFIQCKLKYANFQLVWKSKYGSLGYPSERTIFRLLKKFRRNGRVEDSPRNRKNTARTDENIVNIGAYFHQNPNTSIRDFF